MLEVLQSSVKCMWIHVCTCTCAHTQRGPNFLLLWYFDFPHFELHCFTLECELPGRVFFYVLNCSEFPSAFTWLVVVKIVLGPWDLTLCREDVEFCQPGKYVWLFFFFFSSFHILLFLCGPTELSMFNRNTLPLYLLCATLF